MVHGHLINSIWHPLLLHQYWKQSLSCTSEAEQVGGVCKVEIKNTWQIHFLHLSSLLSCTLWLHGAGSRDNCSLPLLLIWTQQPKGSNRFPACASMVLAQEIAAAYAALCISQETSWGRSSHGVRKDCSESMGFWGYSSHSGPLNPEGHLSSLIRIMEEEMGLGGCTGKSAFPVNSVCFPSHFRPCF